MTSLRQIEANRRNASKSTGPSTEEGKERSRRNAVRHGLTAETVIGSLEDAEDYKRFEEAVTADFHPETAVERELVLRLASLLWRLRRAASIETGLFQASTESVAQEESIAEHSCKSIVDAGAPADAETRGRDFHQPQLAHCSEHDRTATIVEEEMNPVLRLAGRFLNLAAADKGAFERLGRYETALWRQVCQTVFMLEVLRRQSLDMKWLPRSSHPGGSHSFSLSLFPRR